MRRARTAERVRLEARREADRLIAETMAHRGQLLKDLTERRDRGLAQLRDLLAGRDVLVEAIEQVRMTASGLTSNLQEIVTTPTSFISLDPAIEGPGDVLEDGASVAVSRERRPVKARRTRPATGAEVATPGAAEANGDGAPPARTATPAPRTNAAPAPAPAAAPGHLPPHRPRGGARRGDRGSHHHGDPGHHRRRPRPLSRLTGTCPDR